jgi:hypothetical protein
MVDKKSSKTYTNEDGIYWEIEATILYDYVNFANRLRMLQAVGLQHKRFNMQQDGKRMYLVLLTELYQKSLEDLAVILLCFYRRFNADPKCNYQRKFKKANTPIAYTLINYATNEATIKNILDKCPTQQDFIGKLFINELESIGNINQVIPLSDIPKFYTELYQNIFAWMGDQEKRFKIYNKIKHGMPVIGSAQLLNSKNENAPAVIYEDRNADHVDHPLIVHSLHFTEDEFTLLQNGVMKISDCIRDLLALYLCKNYPDFLIKQGFSSPLLFFKERRPFDKTT